MGPKIHHACGMVATCQNRDWYMESYIYFIHKVNTIIKLLVIQTIKSLSKSFNALNTGRKCSNYSVSGVNLKHTWDTTQFSATSSLYIYLLSTGFHKNAELKYLRFKINQGLFKLTSIATRVFSQNHTKWSLLVIPSFLTDKQGFSVHFKNITISYKPSPKKYQNPYLKWGKIYPKNLILKTVWYWIV